MTNVYYPNQTFLNEPTFYDSPSDLIPMNVIQKRVIMPSKMFLIKEELKNFTKENPDEQIYNASQGDGGMSLGGIPPKELADALLRYLPAHGSTKYGDPVGRVDIRKAILQNYYRFDSLTTDNIILGDGGRDLLQKWYQLIQQGCGHTGGSLVVSAAPWGSYMQGTYLNCLNTILAPGSADNGFRLTPEGIDACIAHGQKNQKPVVAMVITTPDNPTGNYLPESEILSLIRHGVKRGIRYILLDFMYQAVTDPDIPMYDTNSMFNALSTEEQNAIFVLDGLTKSVGGSNVRNCHLVFGDSTHLLKLKGLATHSVLPNALGEAAALEVYGHSNPTSHPWVQKVTIPTAKSRSIIKNHLSNEGFRFIAGQGYYAFINVWPWLNKTIPTELTFVDQVSGEKISKIETAGQLKSYLAQKWGLAIVPGTFFYQPHFIRFSYANAPEYTLNSLKRLQQGLNSLQ